MNKIKLFLAIIVLSTSFNIIKVQAQDTIQSADDAAIERALEEEGLLDDPDPIEFEEDVIGPGLSEDELYQDADGNPIGREAFEAIVAENEKTDYVPLLILGLIVLGVATVVGLLLLKISKLKKQNTITPVDGTQSSMSPPVAPQAPLQNTQTYAPNPPQSNPSLPVEQNPETPVEQKNQL